MRNFFTNRWLEQNRLSLRLETSAFDNNNGGLPHIPVGKEDEEDEKGEEDEEIVIEKPTDELKERCVGRPKFFFHGIHCRSNHDNAENQS